jgi:uncharacterized protein (DUF488 family)
MVVKMQIFYYRRKVLLALLQAFGGRLSKIDMQKLLFLFTQEQREPSYEFVPYKYGCYSFQASADKSALTTYGLLEASEEWKLKKQADYIALLTDEDRIRLLSFKKRLGALRGQSLVRYVYERFPYYAIKSEIAHKILTRSQWGRVQESVPRRVGRLLVSIGYEGKSLEQYLNQLISNDVRIVCDVRRNPISMKQGFSKNQLHKALEAIGIRYEHIPELGIPSRKRKYLSSSEDYDALFAEYEHEILPTLGKHLQQIRDMVSQEKRVAVTCFEANHERCHRSRIIMALERIDKSKTPIVAL